MKLDDFCRTLQSKLAATPDAERVATAAQALSTAFRVTPNEVALFLLDESGELLTFAWPPHLTKAGLIPLAARSTIVATVAREGRSLLDNRFSATAHAAYFEQTGKALPSEERLPIQKIICAPLRNARQIVGVVQVCRKAETLEQAGADFTEAELQALTTICATLGASFPGKECAG